MPKVLVVVLGRAKPPFYVAKPGKQGAKCDMVITLTIPICRGRERGRGPLQDKNRRHQPRASQG